LKGDFNLIQDPGGWSFSSGGSNNLAQKDPMLAALGDNGGPTQTMPLLSGSAAVDNGTRVVFTTSTAPIPDAAATNISVADTTGLGPGLYIQIEHEILRITGVSDGTTLTVARGQLGTKAAAHSNKGLNVVLAADQRGVPYVSAPDIGAFEFGAKASQTITFGLASPVTYGVGPITLSATSDSGLPVTFSVVSGPGSVSGNTLTVLGVGSIVVEADQAGNANCNAATAVQQTVAVNTATPGVQVTAASGTYNQSPFTATAMVAGVNGVWGTSLEGVTPTVTYYSGRIARGKPLSAIPILPGTYTVKASFAGSSDYNPASATTTFTIKGTVSRIAGPPKGVPGQPRTYTVAVNGPTHGITFTVNYGDGTVIQTAAGGPSVKLDHIYTATGNYIITVCAKDTNGVASGIATRSVAITNIVMERDPSGGTALAVGGNAAGGDTIVISATNTRGTTLDVTFDNQNAGPYTPSGHIFVYGLGGRDTITLKPYAVGTTNYYIKVPALLYGEGSGGDRISAQGSVANNVLTGQGTNEVLFGGQGRDVLIGGTGAARVHAGLGDDILIGGWTNDDISSAAMTYDEKLSALEAVIAEWASADPYSLRQTKLATFLNTSTVHDNAVNGLAVADWLVGNVNANDWFFAGVNDKVTGKNKNDLVTMIK
jgi:hypothetical protein